MIWRFLKKFFQALFGFTKKTFSNDTGKQAVILEIRGDHQILTAVLRGVAAHRRQVFYYENDPTVAPEKARKLTYQRFYEMVAKMGTVYNSSIERVLKLQVEGQDMPDYLKDVALTKLIREVKTIMTPTKMDGKSKISESGGGSGGGGHGINPLETPALQLKDRGGNT